MHSTTEAKVYVKELGTSIHIKLVENSPSVLIIGTIMQRIGLFIFVAPRRKPEVHKREGIQLSAASTTSCIWWHSTDPATQSTIRRFKISHGKSVCLRKKWRRRCSICWNRSQMDGLKDDIPAALVNRRLHERWEGQRCQAERRAQCVHSLRELRSV